MRLTTEPAALCLAARRYATFAWPQCIEPQLYMLSKKFDGDSIRKLHRMIKDADKIVLTCHVRPDGDAIGSTLGLAHLFNSIGKKAAVVTPDMPPRSLSFLPDSKEIVAFTKYPDFARRLIHDADLIICCDFNKLSRIDTLEPVISGTKCPKVLIDHHQAPDDFADLTFSCPEMSSTCELAFRLVCEMGLYQELSSDAATCLTAGLITDTRNFSVNCSDPEIYVVLIKLLEKGVDKPRIVREALELKSLDCLRLQVYALNDKLEIFDRHKAAIITLDKEELQRFNYQKGDTEGLVNIPLTVDSISYCVFMREDDDCIKVSARSVNSFPVSKICEDLYGGGGHIMAAGGEFHGTLEECRKILIEAMPSYDRFLRKTPQPTDSQKI